MIAVSTTNAAADIPVSDSARPAAGDEGGLMCVCFFVTRNNLAIISLFNGIRYFITVMSTHQSGLRLVRQLGRRRPALVRR